MSPKTDFTMEIPYFDYWDSRGVNRFSLGPTVWELPYGHENTVIRKKQSLKVETRVLYQIDHAEFTGDIRFGVNHMVWVSPYGRRTLVFHK